MSQVHLNEITFIERIIIGNNDPLNPKTEEELNDQLKKLNLFLTKGRIIGQEKSFKIFNIGEHQVVSQYIVYHIGFKRKPHF